MLALRLEVRRGAFALDVALDVPRGPTVVLGPNGAGKTTLLRAILGLVPGVRGTLALDGAVLLDSARGLDVPTEQRRIGWVPQEYALFPHLDVRANVAFGASEDRAAVDAWLDRLELRALATRRPAELSGGERQRVALARALAAGPRALLLDEPLSALDAGSRERTRGLLADTLHSLAIPTLVVTHDAEDVAALDAPVVLLEGGRVRAQGPWRAVGASGGDFARALLGRASSPGEDVPPGQPAAS